MIRKNGKLNWTVTWPLALPLVVLPWVIGVGVILWLWAHLVVWVFG